MKFTHILTFAFVLSVQLLLAQNKEEDSHHHEHHLNDIGIVNSPVYFVNDKEFAYGLHLHYVRNFHESKFGLGIGYERIFDEHKHNTIGIIGSFRPIEKVTINFSPGITFEDGETSELNFAMHLESSYDFEFHSFHIGPVLGFAYDPEDFHISLGLHIGYGF